MTASSNGEVRNGSDLRPSTMSQVRPGADIERARRERSFISMQTTGPAFVPHLVEDWTSGVPLDVAVKRIDPRGSNPTNPALTDP